ncbi:MAG: EF-P lysine aminoacylase GenX [Gammaproteobacteria bacterium]|nr:EF-P lysine aminoacylase GenX [Gammaproteobacteria bacterium]
MTEQWQPGITQHTLRIRAELLKTLRNFFAVRDVLEVQTPLLSRSANPDPNVIPLTAKLHLRGQPTAHYLQTSPEFAMKRLLAAGSPSIYQIVTVFRDYDLSARHLPEFALLEWYRIDFDHYALMNEVEMLLHECLHIVQRDCPAVPRYSYAQLFQQYAGFNADFDPNNISAATLREHCVAAGFAIPDSMLDANNVLNNRDVWLDFILSLHILPQLPKSPLFIYDYPVSQAALAQIVMASDKVTPVAARFELLWGDLELANGFYELTDAIEQRQRFESDLQQRAQRGLSAVTLDENFLMALQMGLPRCAGVALGIERLLMVLLDATHIRQVTAFADDFVNE